MIQQRLWLNWLLYLYGWLNRQITGEKGRSQHSWPSPTIQVRRLSQPIDPWRSSGWEEVYCSVLQAIRTRHGSWLLHKPLTEQDFFVARVWKCVSVMCSFNGTLFLLQGVFSGMLAFQRCLLFYDACFSMILAFQGSLLFKDTWFSRMLTFSRIHVFSRILALSRILAF